MLSRVMGQASLEQVWPTKPVPAQPQLNELTSSVQAPPFAHGFCAQSSMLWLHVGPSNPVPLHWQVYEFTPSMHIPLFWQGCAAHSSKFVSQLVPTYPTGHAQW